MRMSKSPFFFLLLSILFHATANSQSFKNEFGFRSDNDAYLLYGQDRYYTNGLFLYFRHATKQKDHSAKLEKFIYEISAGQEMYNPKSGYAPLPTLHDRPFAAYLYGGIGANFYYSNESVWRFSLKGGTVGPDALGEDAQQLLHRLVGFYQIKGWEYQIVNEKTLNASVNFAKKLYRGPGAQMDLSLDTYLNAGTTFNGAGVGILFRAGNVNPLYQSASFHSRLSNRKEGLAPAIESFFYLRPQFHYVMYDATVSGSLFDRKSPIVFDTKPLVFAQQIGYNFSSSRFTIDFSLLFKSKEIKSKALPHQYGTIALFYRFN